MCRRRSIPCLDVSSRGPARTCGSAGSWTNETDCTQPGLNSFCGINGRITGDAESHSVIARFGNIPMISAVPRMKELNRGERPYTCHESSRLVRRMDIDLSRCGGTLCITNANAPLLNRNATSHRRGSAVEHACCSLRARTNFAGRSHWHEREARLGGWAPGYLRIGGGVERPTTGQRQGFINRERLKASIVVGFIPAFSIPREPPYPREPARIGIVMHEAALDQQNDGRTDGRTDGCMDDGHRGEHCIGDICFS